MPESETGESTSTGEGESSDAADRLAQVEAEAEKWKALARKHEGNAKSNADAAKRLAEMEDAKKSEADKTADRLAKLEQELTESQAQALRFKVAARHNISDEDADLFLTGTDEETLNRQAERLSARKDEGMSGNRNPREGRTPKTKKTDDMSEFARGVFGRDS